jgi:hypothetical protein
MICELTFSLTLTHALIHHGTRSRVSSLFKFRDFIIATLFRAGLNLAAPGLQSRVVTVRTFPMHFCTLLVLKAFKLVRHRRHWHTRALVLYSLPSVLENLTHTQSLFFK